MDTLLHIINDTEALDAFFQHVINNRALVANAHHSLILIENAAQAIRILSSKAPNQNTLSQPSNALTPSTTKTHTTTHTDALSLSINKTRYPFSGYILEKTDFDKPVLETISSNNMALRDSPLLHHELPPLQQITLAQFVTLCLNHNRCISW